MDEPTTTMTVRLPEHLRKRMDRLAASTERSRSWLTVDAIRSYLEAQEWQVQEIEAGIAEADAGEFASDAEVQDVRSRWAVDAD